jgi:hypothetical protein
MFTKPATAAYFIFYTTDTISITVSMNERKYTLIYKSNSNDIFELGDIPVTRWRADPFITILHKLPTLLYVSQNLNTGDFYINYISNKNWYEFWNESRVKTTHDFRANKSCRIFF